MATADSSMPPKVLQRRCSLHPCQEYIQCALAAPRRGMLHAMRSIVSSHDPILTVWALGISPSARTTKPATLNG